MNNLIRLALALSGAALVFGAIAAPMRGNSTGAGAAVGGPVILGGDDLTDHGSVAGDGSLLQGWLYIQRALENIEPNVTRSNDGSIAALGSSPSTATCCDAGAAIGLAAEKVGLDVDYFDGAEAINGFFADLQSGSARPAIIWIAGNGASNNLDSQDEIDALATNAASINSFVNSGGGLLSHGTNYEWLQALLPLSQTVDGGSSGDLYFTDEGLAALPALTVDDINAGPWHNHFTGDLGGLDVLVRSSLVSTCDQGGVEAMAAQEQECEDAPVIIGGSRVSITEDTDPTATPTSCIPPLIGYRCDGKPSSGGGSAATPTPPPTQPTAVSTVAGATVVPTSTRVSQPAGVIRAPDTGDGSGTTGGGTSALTLGLVALAGIVLMGAGVRGLRRPR